MPSDFVVKGKAAMNRVATQLANLGQLKVLIAGKDPTGDITSCALTASVLGDVISANALDVVQNIGAMTSAQKVQVISQRLDKPQMVYINVTPDHHFIVFPVDTDKVVILQGFQLIYNFIEWRTNRGDGIMRKGEFVQAMKDLVSDSATKRKAAALDLFSYKLASKNVEVENKVSAYFGSAAKIVNVASKAL